MLAFQHRFIKPGCSGEMAPSHDQSGGHGGGTCGSEHGTIVEVPKEVVSERPATSSPGIFAPSRCARDSAHGSGFARECFLGKFEGVSFWHSEG